MADKTIDWDDLTALPKPGAQKVFIKQYWSEYSTLNDPASPVHHVPWVEQTGLHCETAAWALLPTMPSARLVYHYGPQHEHSLPQGNPTTNVVKLSDILGWYVKIEFTVGDGTLKWFGIIQEQADEQGGQINAIAAGRQEFVAYGLAQMWNHVVVDDSLWLYREVTGGEGDILLKSGLGLTFNQLERPNRTATKPVDGTAVARPFHVFSPTAPDTRWQRADGTGPGGDLPQWPRAQWWSSRDIMEYMSLYHAPRDYHTSQEGNIFDPPRIPIVVNGLNLVPDWDHPTIQTEGRSALSVMQQICDPSRLLQISVTVTEDGDNQTPDTTLDKVNVNIHSLATQNIERPPGTVIQPRAVDRIDITAYKSADTSVTVQNSHTQIARELNVKGARAETVLTMKVDMAGTPNNDTALHEAWTIESEGDYNAGNETGTGNFAEIQSVNAASRKREKLADVFKTFIVAPGWNGRDKLGAPVFVKDDNVTIHYPYFNEMRIQSVLPFREEVDYASAAANKDDDKLEFRKALVLFDDPFDEGSFWLEGERMMDGFNHTLSVDPNSWKDGIGIRLTTVGQEQHRIAETRFVPNGVDDPTPVFYDYADSLITLSLMDDRYLTYSMVRPTVNLYVPDQLRTKNFYVGASFRKIRVMDQTVVDVSSTNQLQFSQPGLTDANKYLYNEVDELNDLALIAAEWNLDPARPILRLQSSRPSIQPVVGDLVYSFTGNAGLVPIDTTITQITLASPLGINLNVGPLTYTLQTARGEGDIVRFRPPVIGNPRRL